MFRSLLSSKPYSINFSLLLLRLMAGSFMLVHGWPKLTNFSALAENFNPIGIGNELSLALVVFAEVFCSLFIILGLFTRLALIPAIINMLVAVFVAHGSDPFSKKELGLFFLISYIILFLTGPGRYAIGGRRS